MCSREGVDIINYNEDGLKYCVSDSPRLSGDLFGNTSSQSRSQMESLEIKDEYELPPLSSEGSVKNVSDSNTFFRPISIDHVSESSESECSDSSFNKFSTPLVKETTRKLHFNPDTSIIPRVSKSLLTSVAESQESDASILDNSLEDSDKVKKIGNPDVTCSAKKLLFKTFLNNLPLTPSTKASTNENIDTSKKICPSLILPSIEKEGDGEKNREPEKKENISDPFSSSQTLDSVSNKRIEMEGGEVSNDRRYNLRRTRKAEKENNSDAIAFSKLIPKILGTPTITDNKTQNFGKLSIMNSIGKQTSLRKSHKSNSKKNTGDKNISFEDADFKKIMDRVLTLNVSSDEEEVVKIKSSRKKVHVKQSIYTEEHSFKDSTLNSVDNNLFTPRRKLYFRNPTNDFLDNEAEMKYENSLGSNPTLYTPQTQSRFRDLGAFLNETAQTEKEGGKIEAIKPKFSGSNKRNLGIYDHFSHARGEKNSHTLDQIETKNSENEESVVNEAEIQKSEKEEIVMNGYERCSERNFQDEFQIPNCVNSETKEEKFTAKETEGNCSFDVSYLLNNCRSKMSMKNVDYNSSFESKRPISEDDDAASCDEKNKPLLLNNNYDVDNNERLTDFRSHIKKLEFNSSSSLDNSDCNNSNKSNFSIVKNSKGVQSQAQVIQDDSFVKDLSNSFESTFEKATDGYLNDSNSASFQFFHRKYKKSIFMSLNESNKEKKEDSSLDYSRQQEDIMANNLSGDKIDNDSDSSLNTDRYINSSCRLEESRVHNSLINLNNSINKSPSKLKIHSQIPSSCSPFCSTKTSFTEKLESLNPMHNTSEEVNPVTTSFLERQNLNNEVELNHSYVDIGQSPVTASSSRNDSFINSPVLQSSSAKNCTNIILRQVEDSHKDEVNDFDVTTNPRVSFELKSCTGSPEVIFGSTEYEDKSFENENVGTNATENGICENSISNTDEPVTTEIIPVLSDCDDSFSAIIRSKTPKKKNYLNVSDEDITKSCEIDGSQFDDWEKPICFPRKKTFGDKYDANTLILREHEFSSSSDVEITEYGLEDVIEVSSESSEEEEPNRNKLSELASYIHSNIPKQNITLDKSFAQGKKRKLSNVPIPSHSSSPDHTSFLLSLTEDVPPEMCHPAAEKYRRSFQKNKDVLIDLLFKLYNQEIFDSKMPHLEIKWSGRLTTTSGITKSSSRITPAGKVRSSGIKLSKTIVNSAEKLRDVLLHEMCHAANWLIDEQSGGHGPLFRKWTEKARFRFPEIPKVSVCHRYELSWKYIYKCTFCGHEVGKMKLSLKDYACGLCGARVAVK